MYDLGVDAGYETVYNHHSGQQAVILAYFDSYN